MTHEEAVWDALAYRRNTGASLAEIRSYVQFREEPRQTQAEDRAALGRLEADGLLVRVGKRWFLTREGLARAKGPALRAEWKGEDAWVLLALLYSRREDPCGLADLIGMADAINHAILTLEETHGALNRLQAGGLIRTRQGGVVVTPKATGLFSKVEGVYKRYMLDQLEGLGRILDCPCCGVKLRAVRWRIHLDEGTFRETVRAYAGAAPGKR